MTPAEMLEAAMDGTLELDGEQQAEPITQPATGEPTRAQAADDTHTELPDGAPIASKSGAYTIPFEELQKARDKAKALAGENEALKAQLAELSARQQANLQEQQAAAQAREMAGQDATAADRNLEAAQDAIEQGVDVGVFGDFSEEAIAKGIQTLQLQARDALRQELRAEIARELEPIRQQRVQSQVQEHYDAIYAKHADADEIAQSEQFARWQQSLPTFVREGVARAMQEGSADQVIEVFDAFKKQAGAAEPATDKPQAKAAPEVQRRVPNSLSEIAGTPHRDAVQQTLETAGNNPAALLEAMDSMTPAQIERLMNAV